MKNFLKDAGYPAIAWVIGFLIAQYFGHFEERQSTIFGMIVGVTVIVYGEIDRRISELESRGDKIEN